MGQLIRRCDVIMFKLPSEGLNDPWTIVNQSNYPTMTGPEATAHIEKLVRDNQEPAMIADEVLDELLASHYEATEEVARADVPGLTQDVWDQLESDLSSFHEEFIDNPYNTYERSE